MKTRKRATEKALIDSFSRIIDTAGLRPRSLVVGVGDDAAVFRGTDRNDFVVTQDIQVEGRHFRREWLTGSDLGWRLAAVNLSDVAAMGARPLYALFSLVLPREGDAGYARKIVRGIVAHLRRYSAALIGGNISGSDGPLTCDLTLIGACKRGRAWRRRALAGDAIVLIGRLGEAAAGLELLRAGAGPGKNPKARLVHAYLKPRPLPDVAALLCDDPAVHGAIDVSDGFSTDVIHLCEPSRVGCAVDAARLPLSPALRTFCRDRSADPVEWMMRGGEDYALILSVGARRAANLCERVEREVGLPARVVGAVTATHGFFIAGKKGRRRRFHATGWDHLSPR